MKIFDLSVARRDRWALSVAGLLAAANLANPASAQDSAPATGLDDAAAAAPAEAIVVTGSRIARPDLNPVLPISVVSGDIFVKQGHTNIGDTLNDYPQFRTTRGQQNPNLGIGIAGLNLLDLRGLGPARTLVLVNGRRHVAADILDKAVSVDINTIPANLLERTEVVTGGNSAVYGSDAIGGVVNFVLRRNFDGFETGIKTGISTPGSYGLTYRFDALWGKNFAGGRGNITLSAEYNRQNRVYASDLPWLRRADGLVVTDFDPAGLASGSDGLADRSYRIDQRLASIHVNGLVPITQGTAGATCGIGIGNGITPGTPYNCTYIFGADGTLAPQTGTRLGPGVIGTILGGNGQTGREGNLYSVLPRQSLYNLNLLGHYEFSPAAELFWEGKYARITSIGSNNGTGSIQGALSQFDIRERVRLDNPYLSAAARSTIAGALIASGCNPNLTFACNVAGVASSQIRIPLGGQGFAGPLNAADLAAIANGSYRFVIARQLDDVGMRDERFLRQTWRGVLGLRGTFNTDWKYEVALNYGRFTERTDAAGYIDRQRFMLSLDAGRNPATGAIECRAKFDPAAATAFPASAANTARLAADIAACLPYNPFGRSDNSAAIGYFASGYSNEGGITQTDISGYLAGNSRGFLNFQGGPVDFVIGGEYRRETAQYAQDAFAAAGNTNALALGTFAPKPFKVTEGFAELRVPLFKGLRGIEELNLAGAARLSDYKSTTGTVWAYNLGGDWVPVKGLRLRANFSRSVRAPNLSEGFAPAVASFVSGFQDPCAPSRIGAGSQFRGANCTADLGSFIGNLGALGSYSLPIISGANANLKAETADSLTIGAVIQPRLVPGLTLSIDYYTIKVDGVIASLTAQTIANACYDQPGLANPFCASFQRYRGTSAGPLGEVAGQILGNTLVTAPFNFASRKRSGIDTQLAYAADLGGGFGLKADLLYSHMFQSSNFENPALPDFENRLLGELGDPVDELRLALDLSRGPLTFGYELQYIGPMWTGAYEDFNALQDRTAQDADFAEIAKYPAVAYHSISFAWEMEQSGVARNLLFYAGVDNLFNKIPPLGSTATGERIAGGGNGGPIYSVRGRQLYAGVKAKF